MIRIKGVDVPENKCISISLTYIYGIGRKLAEKIATDAKIDPSKKTSDLTEDELTKIRDEISKYTVEGDLRREVSLNIKTKAVGKKGYLLEDKELEVMLELVRAKAKQ